MKYTFAIVLALVLFGADQSVAANPSIRISNDMGFDLTLWIKSEHRVKWNKFRIAKNDTFELSLISPDRFKLVAVDDDNNQYLSRLVSLKRFAGTQPGRVLELRAVFEMRIVPGTEWSQRQRRWVRTQKTQQVGRGLLAFKEADGTPADDPDEVTARPSVDPLYGDEGGSPNMGDMDASRRTDARPRSATDMDGEPSQIDTRKPQVKRRRP